MLHFHLLVDWHMQKKHPLSSDLKLLQAPLLHIRNFSKPLSCAVTKKDVRGYFTVMQRIDYLRDYKEVSQEVIVMKVGLHRWTRRDEIIT